MIIFSPSVLPRHSLALPLECIRGERGCIESQESHPAPCLRYWVKRLILREAIPGMLSGQSEMAFTHVPWCQFSPWKEKEIPSRRDQTFTASPTWVGLAVLRVLSPHQSLGIVGVIEDPAQKMGAAQQAAVSKQDLQFISPSLGSALPAPGSALTPQTVR